MSAAVVDGRISASVALLLRGASGKAIGGAGSGAEILFISRSRREGDPWSGHIAFPGGHAESTDPSLVDTAVREWPVYPSSRGPIRGITERILTGFLALVK